MHVGEPVWYLVKVASAIILIYRRRYLFGMDEHTLFALTGRADAAARGVSCAGVWMRWRANTRQQGSRGGQDMHALNITILRERGLVEMVVISPAHYLPYSFALAFRFMLRHIPGRWMLR